MSLRLFLAALLFLSGGTVRATDVSLKTVLFYGDSLTAGYGLDDPATQAYPALIGLRIRAIGLPWQAVNSGLSGDTTAGGLHRIDWVLRQHVDVLFLELGGNDGLRGLPLDEARKNLQAIINKTRAKYPDVRVVIAGMQIPPNFGPEYGAKFDAMYHDLASANPSAVLLPFLLDGVGGDESLNQHDGIHPTAEGHKKIAESVWPVLEPLLR